MSYEELGNLIDEDRADEIREALNGMSEQELGLLLAMLSPEQAAYVNYLSAFDNAPESFLDKDEMNDWILSNFSGELPDAEDNEAWNKFYAHGSPFIMYETALTDKLSPRIKSDIVNEPEDSREQELIEALNNDDVSAVGLLFHSLVPIAQAQFTKNLTNEQGTKLAEMLNMYEEVYQKDYDTQIDEMYAEHGSEPDTEDVNGDGDNDVATADTNGNGEKDTAVVTADSEPEKKEAVKAAKEDLGLDKEDKTSTGKTKSELEDKNDVVSDEKKKDMTCSDATQKNIMAALLDHRF